MTARSQRSLILNAWLERFNSIYGPAGTEKQFREIRRGAWKPGSPIRPALTLVDDGQELTFHELDDDNNDGSEKGSADATLKIKTVIDLQENWDRVQPYEDWSDIIQTMINRFDNWRPGFGVMNTRCIGDDPFDIVIGESVTQQIWIVEYEVDYFFETGIKT